MQTLKIELEDSIYQNIVYSGIDVQAKVKEFLFDLVDDGYPTISTEEAKKRISDAVDRYENATGDYLSEEEYATHKSQYLKSLKTKYANH
jgi:uncharacterized protein YutD